jgi:hypothetical protein
LVGDVWLADADNKLSGGADCRLSGGVAGADLMTVDRCWLMWLLLNAFCLCCAVDRRIDCSCCGVLTVLVFVPFSVAAFYCFLLYFLLHQMTNDILCLLFFKNLVLHVQDVLFCFDIFACCILYALVGP